MKSDLTSYSDRLREAMEEMGFNAASRGQTRLAELVRCRPQAINQVLSGSSNELSAGPHSRVCAVLGIEALWLVDGVGPKYRLAGRPAQGVREVESLYPATEDTISIDMAVSSNERAFLLKLRLFPRSVFEAIRTIVDTMSKGPL